MKYFNTEGRCIPKNHYMVNMEARLEAIKKQYIERGSYFTINRGRQFGKTTVLRLLQEYLKPDYIALFLDFQRIGTEEFQDAASFVRALIQMFQTAFLKAGTESCQKLAKPLADFEKEECHYSLRELFIRLSHICADAGKPVVLMIDEVDGASDSQVFLDFLSQLRAYYLDREDSPTFQSVILAGVYDVKNLKQKIRPESGHKYNSPWNIAASFNIAMNFSEADIAAMLAEYEADKQTGMDVPAAASEIYAYTSGYPFLVSAICKMLDEKPEYRQDGGNGTAWTREGISRAVSRLLYEPLALFQSMTRQLSERPELRELLKKILFQGKKAIYNPYSDVIGIASMFDYIMNKDGSIQAANRIFETWLYNLFLSEEELANVLFHKAQENYNMFIQNGRLDMKLVLEKFVVHFSDIYGDSGDKFIEDSGRKFFLLYLRPIINGTGNYYIEAQTRNARRTDVIVDYLGEQFVIELKIWHGSEYHERGEAQLSGYLDNYHLEKGYMLSFNFNKNKQRGVKEITIGNKMLIEAVV